MTTIKTLFFAILVLGLTACQNDNYKGENYVSFDSLDALTLAIITSIQSQDETKMLHLLDNEKLILDALFSADGEKANQLKNRINSPTGQKDWAKQKLGQKIRIQTFFGAELEKMNTKQLKLSGVELLEKTPYAKGSPAIQQLYQLQIGDAEGQYYRYNITILFWGGKYHLIAADSHLEPQE